MTSSTSVIDQFKNVFLSSRNTDFLMQNIVKKASEIPAAADKIVTIDQPGLVQLQHFIFDTHFVDITAELISDEPLIKKLKKTLKSLNKITISHMLNLIHQQLTYPETPRTFESPSPDQTISLPQPLPQPQPQPQPQPSLQSPLLQETQIEHIHYFSSDAIVKDGTYSFPLPVCNVESISSFTLNISCNPFNVTEFNNKIVLTESESKPVNVCLPIGFYNRDDLMTQLSNTLNTASCKKLVYTAEIVPQTGKTKLSCVTRDGIPSMFNLTFPDKHYSFNNFGLNELLGFKRSDYYNNNCYISENKNMSENSYQNIYTKLLINGSNVQRIKSSNSGFSYFLALQNKRDNTWAECDEEFVFDDSINIQSVSFQFWNTRDYIITVPLTFDVSISYQTCPQNTIEE